MFDPMRPADRTPGHPVVRPGLYRRHRAGLAHRAPLVEARPRAGTAEQMDDYVTWVTLGIILGGRLGYVLFYRPGYYLFHPLEALMVWQGGMSFHGGALA
jgi:phosphatidylglycerol:prolipoprotein diacylglycerol transferase